MENIKMLIEDALRGLCTEDIIEFENGEKKVAYNLDIGSPHAAAQTIIKAAELIEQWRADRSQAEQYPDSKIKELQLVNNRIGSQLLKAELELSKLRKDLESEAEKQTRLDIMSKRIDKLESERDTYKYCYEFLAVQHKKES